MLTACPYCWWWWWCSLFGVPLLGRPLYWLYWAAIHLVLLDLLEGCRVKVRGSWYVGRAVGTGPLAHGRPADVGGLVAADGSG